MLLDADFQLINEEFYAESVTSAQLDTLLAYGWRHFGTHFFRYNLGVYQDEVRRVLPLRVRLADLKLSKSQRRVLRKNHDLDVKIQPIVLTNETHDLFDRHKGRFKRGVPATINDFLSLDAANEPTEGLEITVRRDGVLLAASFFDLGNTSVSGVYGIFEPDETSRSLGIFTMLKEIEYATKKGKQFYYPGYAYDGESFYDYKKRFSATEVFDWKGNWDAFRIAGSSTD
jgi:arginyl-tRNA--protein-N-Asp/Glu arginylyltransferase